MGEQRYKFSILTNPNLLSYFRLQTLLPKELEERFIAKVKVLGLVGSDNNIAYTNNEDIKWHQMNNKGSKFWVVIDNVKDVIKFVGEYLSDY